MQIEAPYLLFLGDAPDMLAAKVAMGIKQWRPQKCAGQLRLPGCEADCGLEELGIEMRRRTVPEQRSHQVFIQDPNGITIELNFSSAELDALEASRTATSA